MKLAITFFFSLNIFVNNNTNRPQNQCKRCFITLTIMAAKIKEHSPTKREQKYKRKQGNVVCVRGVCVRFVFYAH